MNSQTTSKFRVLLSELTPETRAEARKAYKLFRDNPRHPGLMFNKLVDNVWSARVKYLPRMIYRYHPSASAGNCAQHTFN